MTRIVLATLFALALTTGTTHAQKIDETGRCRDASGKFAKAEVCQPKAADKVSCRDKATKKFAKCDAPNAEPMPKTAAKQ